MADRGQVVSVFGGSGAVGRHLVHRLAQAGWRVRVAVRHPGQAGFLKMSGAVGQVTPVAVDIRDDASVARVIAGADAVVNLIGILRPTPTWGFDLVHVDAAGRIAGQARAAGARIVVHMSALGADATSASAYARSKAAGEVAVQASCPDATILRPSVIFGPEDQFLNRFAAMARLSPILPLIGGGQTRLQPVWVGDVADAIITALAGGKPGRFALGGPLVYTLEAIMRLVARAIGRERRFVSLSWSRAEALAGMLERLPFAPPLTRDQVELLKTDSVVPDDQPGLSALGVVSARTIEVMAPACLARFVPPSDGGLSRRVLT